MPIFDLGPHTCVRGKGHAFGPIRCQCGMFTRESWNQSVRELKAGKISIADLLAREDSYLKAVEAVTADDVVSESRIVAKAHERAQEKAQEYWPTWRRRRRSVFEWWKPVTDVAIHTHCSLAGADVLGVSLRDEWRPSEMELIGAAE